MTKTTTPATGGPQARAKGFLGFLPDLAAAGSVGAREALALGSIGIGSNGSRKTISETARERRFRLRTKVRKYADRTLIPVKITDTERINESVDYATGEIVNEYVMESCVTRMKPRDDKYLACGRRMRDAGGYAEIMLDGTSAGVAGVQQCGSGWSCPVCSGKIQQHRAKELGQVLTWARAEKHTLAMITFTVRHKAGQSLTSVWDAVSDGWAAVTSGRGATGWSSEKIEDFREREDRWDAALQLAVEGKGRYPKGGRAGIRPERWIGDQERYGVLGWARAVEVTNGANGWHVHVHAVVILEGEKAAAEKAAHVLGAAMFARWEKGIAKKKFTAEMRNGGLDVTVSHAAEKSLAEYLAKDGFATDDSPAKIKASVSKKARKLAMEAALGDAKSANRGGKTPFQLLDSLEDNKGLNYRLWREWVRGSEGRLALTWSRGLRELAQLTPEQMDDLGIANEAPGGVCVVRLPWEGYQKVMDDLPAMLTSVETGGVPALVAWLDAAGAAWEYPKAEDSPESMAYRREAGRKVAEHLLKMAAADVAGATHVDVAIAESNGC